MYKKGEIHILVAIIISFLVVGAVVGTVGGGLYVANKIKNSDTTPIVKSEPVATTTEDQMELVAEIATTSTSTQIITPPPATPAPVVTTPKPAPTVVAPKPPVVTSTVTDADLVAARAMIEQFNIANIQKNRTLVDSFLSTQSLESLKKLRDYAKEPLEPGHTRTVTEHFSINIIINSLEKSGVNIIANLTIKSEDGKTDTDDILLIKENGIWKIGFVEAAQVAGNAFETAQKSIDPSLPFSLTVTDVKFSTTHPIVNDPEFTILITFKNTGSRVPIGGLYSYVELEGVFSTGVNIGSWDETFYPGESITVEYKPYREPHKFNDPALQVLQDDPDTPGKKILKIKYNENGTRENPPAPSTDKIFTKEFEVFAN